MTEYFPVKFEKIFIKSKFQFENLCRQIPGPQKPPGSGALQALACSAGSCSGNDGHPVLPQGAHWRPLCSAGRQEQSWAMLAFSPWDTHTAQQRLLFFYHLNQKGSPILTLMVIWKFSSKPPGIPEIRRSWWSLGTNRQTGWLGHPS